jgi:histone demethylase JARID1
VKIGDSFVCPVCDWQGFIPREANRPRLEELEDWLSQSNLLPLCPEELLMVRKIVQCAEEFRGFLVPVLSNGPFDQSSVPILRHYLTKLEGGDVLLSSEIDFIRQELFRLAPLSEIPPPPAESANRPKTPKPIKTQETEVEQKPPHYHVDDTPQLPEAVSLNELPTSSITTDYGDGARTSTIPLSDTRL